jgi:hypothetical protein
MPPRPKIGDLVRVRYARSIHGDGLFALAVVVQREYSLAACNDSFLVDFAASNRGVSADGQRWMRPDDIVSIISRS